MLKRNCVLQWNYWQKASFGVYDAEMKAEIELLAKGFVEIG
jgi:hypothetical protein